MAIVPTVPNVRLLFGPMLIGVFLNMILYGILIVQTYHYYLTYKGDARWIKYLVIYVFLMETLNTGCNMAMMYQPLIQNFGRPVATTLIPTLFAAEPVTIVAISTPIQLFFAYRIWLLSKNNWLPGVIAFFAVVSLGGGTWTTVLIVKVKVFARKPELHWPALLWFLSAVVSDVMITVVLVITLTKRKTGFTATDDVISKIIRTTVQTGMLTALFAIGDVIFFMTLPHTALNFIWDFALTKLYANCLLSTLNARAKLNETSGKYSNQNNVQLSSGDRRLRDLYSPTKSTSAFYDLDTPQIFGSSDPESGIRVTKVVNTKEYSNSTNVMVPSATN